MPLFVPRRIGKSGDYSELDALSKVAKDPKPYLALAAVDALGRLRLPETRDQLRKLLAIYKSGNDHGRVLRALASVGRDDPAVVQLVLKEAHGTTDVTVRAMAICALGTLPTSPEIEEFLRKTCSDANTAARASAAWAIGMGRHKGCRAELEKLAASDTMNDLKEIANLALKHFDHALDDTSCCALEGSIWRFVQLGNPRQH